MPLLHLFTLATPQRKLRVATEVISYRGVIQKSTPSLGTNTTRDSSTAVIPISTYRHIVPMVRRRLITFVNHLRRVVFVVGENLIRSGEMLQQ